MLQVPSLTWHCHATLDAAEADWRALQRTGRYRIFQDFDWVSAWYGHIGREAGIEPRIVVARASGMPQLLFPLGLSRSGPLRRLEWLAAGWNDYNAPLIAAGDPVATPLPDGIWHKITETAGGCDLLEIAKQAPHFGDNRPNPFVTGPAVLEDNSTHLLDLDSDLDALRASIHSAKTWGNFDRKRRKLESLGPLEFRLEEEAASRETVMRDMLAAKSETLTRIGKRDPFSSAGAVAFMTAFVRDNPESARLYTLRLDGQPIVTTLCLAERETMLLYQTVYDREHGKYSPGALLLHHIIFEAARAGYATFDCLFGDDPYKLQICNRSVPLTRALIAMSAAGRFARLAGTARRGAARHIKKSPALYKAALRLNRALHVLPGRR